MLGQRISHYVVLEEIGRGGMGVVYRGVDTLLNRPVAIKTVRAELVADRDGFLHEARAAAALSHPHVAHVYEIGEAKGVPFLGMEYVEGRRLDAHIRAHRLAAPEILQIAIQITDALAAAHSKEITHRDIKPGNVMITPQGQVKVLDFGLAKLTALADRPKNGDHMNQVETLPQTIPGLVVGTVQ